MKIDHTWRLILESEPPDPRDWSLQTKWMHHMRQAESLLDTKPDLAQCWLHSADLLWKQMHPGESL